MGGTVTNIAPQAEAVAPAARQDMIGGLARGRGAVEAALQAAPPRVFAAGKRLAQPGAALFRLRRGWAMRDYDWPDGKRAIVDVYLPGELIGVAAALSGGPADPVVAVTPITTQAIPAAAVPALLANRNVALYLAHLAAAERRRVDRLAAAIARLDAQRRLVAMLLDFARRLRHDGNAPTLPTFHLPLTQQQIGDHLGLTVVHVNRVLRSLREAELIDLDRHVLVLRDPQRLERLVAGAPGADRPNPASEARVMPLPIKTPPVAVQAG
jgi:CRP/FNR family transcriptional regulator, anaerobic regulatory protein